MEPIEMARECAFFIMPETYSTVRDECRNGYRDDSFPVKSALAMHAMRQAEIAELVDCLAAAFADPMRLITSESAMNEAAALIGKHRADAFAKWVEGIEP